MLRVTRARRGRHYTLRIRTELIGIEMIAGRGGLLLPPHSPQQKIHLIVSFLSHPLIKNVNFAIPCSQTLLTKRSLFSIVPPNPYPNAAPLRQTISPFPLVSNHTRQSGSWPLACASQFGCASNGGSQSPRVLPILHQLHAAAGCQSNTVSLTNDLRPPVPERRGSTPVACQFAQTELTSTPRESECRRIP